MSAFLSTARIALCQVLVGADKAANFQRVQSCIGTAVKQSLDSQKPVQMVVLPEIWNSPYANASFPVYAEVVPNVGQSPDKELSPSVSLLCELAKAHNVWIIGGSVPEKVETTNGVTKLYNTCTVVNPAGSIVGKHRKVHLFDIDVPGKITFRESDTLTAGDAVTVVTTPWGNVGIGICYDIRFPELAAVMRQRDCRLLVYPGAFNMTTGPLHWELLQRARAVDNQCYVVTCSPARDTSSGGYVAWGHSSVVSPWGEVIATSDGEPATVYADLDFDVVATCRQNLPYWTQKRNDLYSISDFTK